MRKKQAKKLKAAERIVHSLNHSSLRRLTTKLSRELSVYQETANRYDGRGIRHQIVLRSDYIERNPAKAADEIRAVWANFEAEQTFLAQHVKDAIPNKGALDD
ncbi:hypothetical protein ACKU27_13000 [Sphingobium yanoikuyae]|jgi:hypothetical protein|uniref:hypothetical protein n=1 Tax=Sphingobium yanoikuyae TaxID=13690 RepID=UPI002FDEEE49